MSVIVSKVDHFLIPKKVVSEMWETSYSQVQSKKMISMVVLRSKKSQPNMQNVLENLPHQKKSKTEIIKSMIPSKHSKKIQIIRISKKNLRDSKKKNKPSMNS